MGNTNALWARLGRSAALAAAMAASATAVAADLDVRASREWKSPAKSLSARALAGHGDDWVAAYIIAKMLDNFQYRGFADGGDWLITDPVIAYERPYFTISYLKRTRVPGEFDREFAVGFRVDMRDVKSAAISTGALHVDCFSNCVDATSNGATGRYNYFWINGVQIHNFVDASRVNRAFEALKALNPTPKDPFD